jgi:hypothetical protein
MRLLACSQSIIIDAAMPRHQTPHGGFRFLLAPNTTTHPAWLLCGNHQGPRQGGTVLACPSRAFELSNSLLCKPVGDDAESPIS